MGFARLPSSLIAVVLLAAGCSSHYVPPTTQPAAPIAGLSQPMPDQTLQAIICPPIGWRLDSHEDSSHHHHWTWLSPTGDTAYGVIYVPLPLPVGPDFTLMGFMAEMRQKEGEGTLLSKEADPSLPGLRFLAEGGPYKIRANLITHGFQGWIFYAGTLRAHAERPDELNLAIRARDATVPGVPK
jgi:hypothetical protein